MTATSKLHDLIQKMGEKLEFEVATEVAAAESAWVDVVWFDKRLSPGVLGFPKSRVRYSPVLPVVGFEIELKTGNNAKHIKGSVSNLNNLGALLGVIVIGSGSVTDLQRSRKGLAATPIEEVEQILMDRVYRWVYAESQPSSRIVIMSESDVVAWAERLGLA